MVALAERIGAPCTLAELGVGDGDLDTVIDQTMAAIPIPAEALRAILSGALHSEMTNTAAC